MHRAPDCDQMHFLLLLLMSCFLVSCWSETNLPYLFEIQCVISPLFKNLNKKTMQHIVNWYILNVLSIQFLCFSVRLAEWLLINYTLDTSSTPSNCLEFNWNLQAIPGTPFCFTRPAKLLHCTCLVRVLLSDWL